MNIRTRLTLLFIGIVFLILSVSFIAIYLLSSDYRQEDFYLRLASKATNVAKLLIEVDEVDATLLSKIEQNNPTSLPQERITILNYRNEILYSSDSAKEITIASNLLDRIRLEGDVRFRQGDFEVLGILYADRFDRFVVIAGAKDIIGLRKLKNLQAILLISFFGSMGLVSLSAWLYAGKALAPISKVISEVDTITATSLNVRVAEGNQQDEIGRLALTFNRMLDRLENAFGIQRNFIANASHELRTPLTAITGKIEVTLLQPRTKERYEEVLQDLSVQVRNINQLSNRLLLLAQASDDGSMRRFGPIRVDEVLWQAKEDELQIAPHYKIDIDLDRGLDDELLTIRGDEQLMKAAFVNLIDNACKYSDNHSVTIHVHAVNKNLILEFIDQGVGISSEEIGTIFEPFFRGKNTLKKTGHGIGLSLINRIIKIHNGRIEVRSELNQGTVFTVHVPLFS